jgi:sporulation protein YlmC with PRC-barrel domain
MKRLDLTRDLLDKQVVDQDGAKMGRVDSLILELRGDRPPRVEAIEMGFTVLARRMGPRVERWVERLRRWSVRKTAVQRVAWTKVLEVEPHHVKLDVKALDTPAFDWERWLRDHFVAKAEAKPK